MKRPIVIAGAIAGIVVLAGLGGAYAYFFSGLRTAPKPLALSTTTPGTRPATTAPAGALVGNWSVTQGSEVGYLVTEQFAGQTSSHKAQARTSSVSGGLAVQQGASGLQATAIKFTAQLSNLHSVDQVPGFDVSRRDSIVQRSLSVFQYPDATFQVQSVDLPASIASGATQTLTVPGQLTIHGVTRPVQVSVQISLSDAQAQAAGSTSFDMTEFGISPPQAPFVGVQPQVTLDFKLSLAKSAGTPGY